MPSIGATGTAGTGRATLESQQVPSLAFPLSSGVYLVSAQNVWRLIDELRRFENERPVAGDVASRLDTSLGRYPVTDVPLNREERETLLFALEELLRREPLSDDLFSLRGALLKVLVLAVVTFGFAAAATAAGSDHHVKAPLVPVGSSVSGFVQLVQLPHGGTSVHVVAHGLTPGVSYTSFYYDGANCEIGPEEVGTFTANAAGRGSTHAKIDDDLDEVASISVRTPDYSVLFACANVH